MLASKLLPEQEEQQLQQLDDLRQEQGSSGGRHQTAYVQVCCTALVQLSTAVMQCCCIFMAFEQTQFLWMFGVHVHHLCVTMDDLPS